MTYHQNVWAQLKNITADELIRALLKDGWTMDAGCGSIRIFLKAGRRASIHYHPGKTYGKGLLKGILDSIGRSETDMRRLKLVK